LGAFVIIERLHALLVTLHLGIGIILFSMVVMVTLYAWKIQDNKEKSFSKLEKSTVS
jgi:cytochrome c oxidase assembly protein subunit 15